MIKGEVSGQDPLFVDGTVEGSIHFPEHRVTVGRMSQVNADITAHDAVVMGSVKGNIHCNDLLDVRAECTIRDMVTRRIGIDDGAVLRGSVEIEAAAKSVKAAEPVKTGSAAPTMAQPLPRRQVRASVWQEATCRSSRWSRNCEFGVRALSSELAIKITYQAHERDTQEPSRVPLSLIRFLCSAAESGSAPPPPVRALHP